MALFTTHHDRGYIYAREVDRRLLIGGDGIDCASEEERAERLVSWAQTHIHGAANMQVEHRWVGNLAWAEGPHCRKRETRLARRRQARRHGSGHRHAIGQNLQNSCNLSR